MLPTVWLLLIIALLALIAIYSPGMGIFEGGLFLAAMIVYLLVGLILSWRDLRFLR